MRHDWWRLVWTLSAMNCSEASGCRCRCRSDWQTGGASLEAARPPPASPPRRVGRRPPAPPDSASDSATRPERTRRVLCTADVYCELSVRASDWRPADPRAACLLIGDTCGSRSRRLDSPPSRVSERRRRVRFMHNDIHNKTMRFKSNIPSLLWENASGGPTPLLLWVNTWRFSSCQLDYNVRYSTLQSSLLCNRKYSARRAQGSYLRGAIDFQMWRLS